MLQAKQRGYSTDEVTLSVKTTLGLSALMNSIL